MTLRQSVASIAIDMGVLPKEIWHMDWLHFQDLCDAYDRRDGDGK